MEGLNSIAAVIATFGSAIGIAIGNGQTISKTIELMTRRPEMFGQLRTTMFTRVVLIEVMPTLDAIVSLLLLLK